MEWHAKTPFLFLKYIFSRDKPTARDILRRKNRNAFLRRLGEKSDDPVAPITKGEQTALHIIAKDSSFFTIPTEEEIARFGLPKDRRLRTPLHIACRHGNSQMVRKLLDANIGKENIDLPDHKGMTPLCNLMRTIGEYSSETRMLIDAGADVNHMTTKGDTPLKLALDHGKTICAEMLIDAGAKLHLPENGMVHIPDEWIANGSWRTPGVLRLLDVSGFQIDDTEAGDLLKKLSIWTHPQAAQDWAEHLHATRPRGKWREVIPDIIGKVILRTDISLNKRPDDTLLRLCRTLARSAPKGMLFPKGSHDETNHMLETGRVLSRILNDENGLENKRQASAI